MAELGPDASTSTYPPLPPNHVWLSDGTSVELTPGMPDANAFRAYQGGQCAALAISVAEDQGWGWDVAFVTYDDPDAPNGESYQHAYAVRPDGKYVDITGEVDPTHVDERLFEQLDTGESYEDVMELTDSAPLYRHYRVTPKKAVELIENRYAFQTVPQDFGMAREFVAEAVTPGAYRSRHTWSPAT